MTKITPETLVADLRWLAERGGRFTLRGLAGEYRATVDLSTYAPWWTTGSWNTMCEQVTKRIGELRAEVEGQ